MKMVCEFPAGTLRNNITTAPNIGTVGLALKNLPGVGKPFLIFANWSNPPTMVDFDMFPQYVVSSVVSENVDMIEAMLADPPTAALTF